MMTLLTQAILDRQLCNNPDCQDPNCGGDKLYLHAHCHPDAPTWACYSKSEGTLALFCSVCDQAVAVIGVQDR